MQREVTTQPFERLRPREIDADIILRPRCEVSHFDMAYEICIHNTVDTNNPAVHHVSVRLTQAHPSSWCNVVLIHVVHTYLSPD